MNVCHACGQSLPDQEAIRHITDRELDVLSAWWLLHSTRAVARFFGMRDQTVKTHLYNARRRNGVHTSVALAQLFMAQLRPMDVLLARQHNVSGAAA